MAGDPLGLAYLNRASSPLHRMSPTSKMVWLTCVIVLSFASDFVHLAVLAAAVLVVALAMTGTSFGNAWKPIKLLIILWGPFVVLPPIAFYLQADLMGLPESDAASLPLFGLTIPYSRSGLEYGVIVFLRGLIAAIACLTVVWTTHPRDIVHALTVSARLPYRFGWAIFLAIIYTPLIVHEYEIITYAKAVRGLRNRPGPIGMIDSIRNTFIPLLVRGLRKGHVTSLAMESRAFGAHPGRTFRHPLPRSSLDGLLAWGSVLVTLAYFGWILGAQRVLGS